MHQGKPVRIEGQILYEHEYSDRLLERLLEASDPDKFRRRTENINLLDIDVDKLTPAQQDMIVDNVLKRHMSAEEAAEYRKQLEAAIEIEARLIEEDPAPQL